MDGENLPPPGPALEFSGNMMYIVLNEFQKTEFNMIKKIFFSTVIAFAGAITLAAVTVPAIFSDGAVLAKRENVPVFGRGTPGEKVTVKFGSQTRQTVVGTDGKWEVALNLKNFPATPQNLYINDMVIKDVIPGEVFLASGQSNMAFKLPRAIGGEEECKRPANRNIRFFIVQTAYSDEPLSELRGKWVIADSETRREFTAVGYFFAEKLNRTLNVPVAIVSASLAGTPLEGWMSKESVAPFPKTVKIGKNRMDALKSYPARLQKFLKATAAWEKKYQRTDIPVKLPAADLRWEPHSGDISGGGICWLRNRIVLSEKDVKNGFKIYLGRIYAPIKIFIDGKKVLDGGVEKAWSCAQFSVDIRPGEFTAGPHEILVRYWVSHDRMHMPQPFRFGSCTIDGKGWEIYREKSFPVCRNEMLRSRPRPPGSAPMPSRQWYRLYNAMIHPLIPFRFSGVIWYQGEGNASRYADYGKVFSAMITDWRKKFRNGDMPFYFCQLPSFQLPVADPAECSNWAYLRREQTDALKLPRTGMAVLTDVGECRDLHPLEKRIPGERLALQALAQIYGKKIPFKSPDGITASAHGNEVKVTFSHTDGGLKAAALPEKLPLKKSNNTATALIRRSPGAMLEGFALCGKDGKWFWADKAEIAGDAVVLSSKKVPEPVKVRYNWSSFPLGNLYSQAGLPVAPFELTVTAR